MLKWKLLLFIPLALLAVATPRFGGQNTGAEVEGAIAGEPLSSPSPPPGVLAAQGSRDAGDEARFLASVGGAAAGRPGEPVFARLDGVERELLSVFVFVAGVLSALVITSRIRRGDYEADEHDRPATPPASAPGERLHP